MTRADHKRKQGGNNDSNIWIVCEIPFELKDLF